MKRYQEVGNTTYFLEGSRHHWIIGDPEGIRVEFLFEMDLGRNSWRIYMCKKKGTPFYKTITTADSLRRAVEVTHEYIAPLLWPPKIDSDSEIGG